MNTIKLLKAKYNYFGINSPDTSVSPTTRYSFLLAASLILLVPQPRVLKNGKIYLLHQLAKKGFCIFDSGKDRFKLLKFNAFYINHHVSSWIGGVQVRYQ